MASKFLRLISQGQRVAKALPCPHPAILASFRQYSTPVEDDVVKAAFIRQQSQFRKYLQELSAVPIPLNPDDSKGVAQYAEAVKGIREKVGIRSFSEKLADLLESAEEESQEVREFLNDATTIRREIGVEDVLKVEPLLYAALDCVEKKIGKPLTTADAQGLAAFQQELGAINTKLGLKESDLEKLESELDVKLAKAEIEQLRNETVEKINTYKRRDALDDIDLDLKELKPTAYL